MRSELWSDFRRRRLRNWRCAATVQAIGTHTMIHTQAEYEQLMGLRDKF